MKVHTTRVWSVCTPTDGILSPQIDNVRTRRSNTGDVKLVSLPSEGEEESEAEAELTSESEASGSDSD